MPAPRTGRRQWLILGFSVVGPILAVTVLTFFLPLVLSEVTDSQLAIGAALGVEGVIALTIPLIVGQASDRTWNRFGRRLPYMLLGTPLVMAGLLAVAFLHNYWLLLAAIALFFTGYYTYYTAYQALYPDTLPDNQYGRAWAIQSLFQGAGTGIALLVGGALVGNLGVPFLAAAIAFGLITVITYQLVHETRRPRRSKQMRFYQALPNFFRRISSDRNLRLFLGAHFCWEYILAAIRTFVLLYLLRGLGLTTPELLPVLATIIFVYLVASLVSGEIADRYDPRRYTAGMVLLFAATMLVMGLSTDQQILRGILPFGMFAGAAVLMLSYPILLRVTPADRRGEYTGYYQFNRGLALILGTSLTGFLIDRFGHFFPATDGYQVLWLVTAVVCFVSLPVFLRLTGKRQLRTQPKRT